MSGCTKAKVRQGKQTALRNPHEAFSHLLGGGDTNLSCEILLNGMQERIHDAGVVLILPSIEPNRNIGLVCSLHDRERSVHPVEKYLHDGGLSAAPVAYNSVDKRTRGITESILDSVNESLKAKAVF